MTAAEALTSAESVALQGNNLLFSYSSKKCQKPDSYPLRLTHGHSTRCSRPITAATPVLAPVHAMDAFINHRSAGSASAVALSLRGFDA